MKYIINNSNYKDFKVFELAKRPGRAYFIPYTKKKVLESVSFGNERYSSDITHVLSGEWDFKYYPKLSKMPAAIDSSRLKFDKITVPTTWQRTGYELPAYINCPYEFDNVPPELPDEMSVGVYRKTFSISDLRKNYILAFLGVIPCIDLYLNGEYIGYSEGAHNTAEFDLTGKLTEGNNEILVVLHKWSTATFLECQDMFRENGIFRDVLLYEMPEAYINDYYLDTHNNAESRNVDVNIFINGCCDNLFVDIEIKSGDKVLSAASAPAAAHVTLNLSSAEFKEWNAEIPVVYETYITLRSMSDEIMSLRSYLGFKEIKIDGDVFKFNGAAIKIKGVNHHDTHPETGYVMSFEDLEKDIKLMKSLNVNAVRTSHYPPDPHLLMLADIYGLYVIDEADIETHGCGCPPHHQINMLSHDKKWAPRYVDRVSRMFYRDRNHPCITMWSLGNEAGGYKCQDACYKFLKTVTAIPVHYEGVCRTKRYHYDVFSEMYTHIDFIKKLRDNKRGKEYKNVPFYLCEYCHAMGVGPGGLEDYWNLFYSSDKLMGGCIWEWADHAVYHKNGPLKYTYGGDHREWRHDGNFCVDGLIYPDRTPHTGAYAMQAVYRPLMAKYIAGNLFEFINTNRFRNSDYISVNWKLLKNGIEINSGKLPILNIEPCQKAEIEIPLPQLDSDNEYFVNFEYFNENAEFIAKEQVILNEAAIDFPVPVGSSIQAELSDNKLNIVLENGTVIFDKKSGNIESYEINGLQLINTSPVSKKSGFVPNIFRAFLDNDKKIQNQILKYNVDKAVYKNKSFSYKAGKNAVNIKTGGIIKGGKKPLFEIELIYKIYPLGKIDVTAKLKAIDDIDTYLDIQRFGLNIELPECFDNVEYYGLGEKENLIDLKAQATIGIYKTTVDDMQEPYIKPQDSGNRSQVRILKLTDKSGKGIIFYNTNKKFTFNVHRYSQELLKKAMHQEDLHDEGTLALSIDGFTRGTGTASCGPDTFEHYKIKAKKLSFGFSIAPID